MVFSFTLCPNDVQFIMLRDPLERKHNHLSTEQKRTRALNCTPFFPLPHCFHFFTQSLLLSEIRKSPHLSLPPPAAHDEDSSQAVSKAIETIECSLSDSESCNDGDATSAPRVRKGKKPTKRDGVYIAGSDGNIVPQSMEQSEYSAPRFMSLVCVMQMVKLMDAVGILFPQTLAEGTQPITTKREFAEQVNHAKMSAHIDCPNCKAFVSYRWYANDIHKLKTHLSAADQENKKVSSFYPAVAFVPGVMSCRLSAAAALVIGSASRPVPNLAVAMQRRCVHHRIPLCFCNRPTRCPVTLCTVAPALGQL